MASVFSLPPLLFATFKEMYNISYTLLGTLVFVNFCTQLGVDLVFSFFSKYFNIHKGILRINKKGFGFVDTSDLENDIYISKFNLNSAMDGDEVLVVRALKGNETMVMRSAKEMFLGYYNKIIHKNMRINTSPIHYNFAHILLM